MNIWLDDIRDPYKFIPEKASDFVWIKTGQEAIKFIEMGNVRCISFDHDLGDEFELTGYDVAKHIEELCYHGKIECPKWSVHSSNPKGRIDIELAMKAAEKFSNK